MCGSRRSGSRPQVKASGSALIGRHDDSIVGLGFQQPSAFAGREVRDNNTTTLAAATTTPGATATGFDLEDKAVSPVAEEPSGSGGVRATKPGRRQGSSASRLGSRRSGRNSSSGGDAATTLGSGSSSEPGVAEEDGEEEEEEEEEVALETVVLSASMDGIVRAWEMLGKSEKYRMRHPAGVEVTSMLVLPGGALLVTGEISHPCDWFSICLQAVAAPGPIGSFHQKKCAVPYPPAFSQKTQGRSIASCSETVNVLKTT